MLLPSTAANPASMMAQALTIYKSLIGNNLGGGQHESSHSGPLSISRRDFSYGKAGDESPTPVKDPETISGIPIFSLQSPKKEEES